MKEFIQQLDRIEAKIDHLISPLDPVVGRKEAMFLTGTKSSSALDRELKKLGVRPFSRGKYRRIDITNAVGRRVLASASK